MVLWMWRYGLGFTQGAGLVLGVGQNTGETASRQASPDLHPLVIKHVAIQRDALLGGDLAVGAGEGLVAEVDQRAVAVECDRGDIVFGHVPSLKGTEGKEQGTLAAGLLYRLYRGGGVIAFMALTSGP